MLRSNRFGGLQGLSRRDCIRGVGATFVGGVFLSGCGGGTPSQHDTVMPYKFSVRRDYSTESYPVFRVRRSKFAARLHPHVVRTPFRHKTGTLIVDTANNYIYLQIGEGKARRYGVGVGRVGLGVVWHSEGRAETEVASLEPNSTDACPGTNIARIRCAGPAQSPMGARAMYLFKNGVDTLYRIHGTSERVDNWHSRIIRLYQNVK